MSWQIDFGGFKNGFFKREMVHSTQQIEKWVRYFNNKDVYLGCYYKFNQALYGYFYLDFDCDLKNDFSQLKEEVLIVAEALQEEFQLKPEHMQFYFSGAKGFHLLIAPYNLGFSLSPTLHEQYKQLALYYQKISPFVDTKIYDTRRVLRLPNSINSKTGLYKIPLTYQELLLSDYEMICQLAAQPRALISHAYVSFAQHLANQIHSQGILKKMNQEKQLQKNRQRKAFDKSLLNKEIIFPCIYQMLHTVHEEGERNKRLIIIASHLLQKQIPVEEAQAFLIQWNQDYLAPPLEEREVITTVQSAYYQLQQGRRYGCQAILEIGACDFNCGYHKPN